MNKEEIKDIFKEVKPYFNDRLGPYTHKRVTEEWYFRGLGFVKDDMGYVFGINLGFFKREFEDDFNLLGMNVLVRTNGEKPELRQKFLDFFKENLDGWPIQPIKEYTSERGGVGTEFPRYKYTYEFLNNREVVAFLKDSIDSVHKVYDKIITNPEGIFEGVLRAAPPWKTTLVELAEEFK